jgi:hypothetical protein
MSRCVIHSVVLSSVPLDVHGTLSIDKQCGAFKAAMQYTCQFVSSHCTARGILLND